MTLRQLRYLCEIVRRGLHLSQAAEALSTSQPGVSKQIQLLEEELGIVIFNRKRNRVLSLTAAGQEVYRLAERALLETQNIKEVGREFGHEVSGKLVIATTHTQARYVLPEVVGRFVQRFPSVRLEFWQGNRQEIFRRVELGEADLAIGTDGGAPSETLALLRYGTLEHCLVARDDHPLLGARKLTLSSLAANPLITHSFDTNGMWKLGWVFEAEGMVPNIVFRAADADVCKEYVRLGIGVAVLAKVACVTGMDSLATAPVDHLFKPEPLFIGIRRNRYYRSYVYQFIEMFAPNMDRATVTALAE